MKFFKNFFEFLIYSNIYVALAVCAFVGVTCLEFTMLVSNSFLGFIFFGTIVGYNFIKFYEVLKVNFRDLNIFLKIVQVGSLIALLYFAFQLSVKTLMVAGGFALLTFFYAIPFLKNKNLRTLTGLKITIVATVWAGVTVLLPMVNNAESLNSDIWISFVQRLLFVFVLTLPFEIRDLKYDALALGTLPQQVGINKTKITGIILLIIALLLECVKLKLNWSYLISFTLICGVMGVFLMLSTKNQSKYFSSFWVESIPIIWFALFLMLQNYLDVS